jgi:hypothetical protein
LGIYPNFEYVTKAMAGLGHERLCIVELKRSDYFPYTAPKHHNSATGNALLAHEYLSLLLGKSVEASIILATAVTVDSAVRVAERDMSSYEVIGVGINGMLAGQFASSGDQKIQRASFLRDSGIQALIALRPPQRSLLDAAYLAMSTPLDRSSSPYLVHTALGETRRVPLARLTELVDGLNLGVLDFPAFTIPRRTRTMMVQAEAFHPFFGTSVSGGTLRVEIGDSVLLEGTYDDRLKAFGLVPPQQEIYWLRSAMTSGDVAVDRGRKSGTADLLLKHREEVIRIPLAHWQIKQQIVNPSAQCPQNWVPPLAPLLR